MKHVLVYLQRGLLTTLLLLGAVVMVNGQGIPENNVPYQVREAFKKNQSSAKADWSMGPKGVYEARFTKSGSPLVFVYNPKGLLTVKKKAVNPILIPNSINTDLAGNFSSFQLDEVFQVISRSKEKYYEVHASSQGQVKRMRYSLAGAYVSAVDVSPSEATSTLVASSTRPQPVVASNVAPPAAGGGMRGDADADFDDMELIDDDIADLFQEEDEEELFLDPADDDSWEDIILDEEDDDFGDDDLDDWDIPEDGGF